MPEIFGTLLGGLFGLGQSGLNNYYSEMQASQARRENYMYGEMAANNADKRTRALYNDFYSPSALLRQYREAGLSPSMMFGGTPGQGGMSGAQGTGAAGIPTQYMPISMVEAAQAANLIAQTKKTNAETKNIEQDTTIKEIETKMKEMEQSNYATEWTILNSSWTDSKTGNAYSLFEMAKNHYTFESFLDDVRYNGKEQDPTLYELTQTEQGQKTLREIYYASSKFDRDIMVLSEELVNSSFQLEIINKLNDKNFTELNAQAAVQQLKAMKSASELTETQKEAWNNLIDKLGRKGSTMRDIVVVLGMILGNFASHTGIKINVGDKK